MLSDLLWIFNSPANLCLVDAQFNSDKVVFLRSPSFDRARLAGNKAYERNTAEYIKKHPQTTDNGSYPNHPPPVRPPIATDLRKYYTETWPYRRIVRKFLMWRLSKTKNLMYWAISQILQEYVDGFSAEQHPAKADFTVEEFLALDPEEREKVGQHMNLGGPGFGQRQVKKDSGTTEKRRPDRPGKDKTEKRDRSEVRKPRKDTPEKRGSGRPPKNTDSYPRSNQPLPLRNVRMDSRSNERGKRGKGAKNRGSSEWREEKKGTERKLEKKEGDRENIRDRSLGRD